MKIWSEKSISLEITLGNGKSKFIEGLACEVSIQKSGLPDKNTASVLVYGLSLEDMSQLSFLSFLPMQTQAKSISLRAGEKGGQMSLAFTGEISCAYADFNSAPDIAFKIEAMSGYYPQQISAPPLSVQGEAKASSLIEQMASIMGYSFKNEGVESSLNKSIFSGSPLNKAYMIAEQVGADLLVDDGSLVLMPRNKSRSGSAVFLSSESGLIGYPTFNNDGISCKCFYNPNLEHYGLVEIKSIVPKASGTWRIVKLSHKLAAFKDGPWESEIEAHYA